MALDAIDIQMRPGVTGLVGANGAGKTTLLNALLGVRPPTSGSATVLGLDPRSQGAALRAQVGFAPERDVLPDEMRAVDFVRHLAQVRGLPRSEARTRASDSLWLVGLGEERTRTLGTMSTGQRQRVKLAQAVASDPQLVLLDEPTSGLDPSQRSEMLDLIGEISSEHSMSVVLSSHLLEEVERVCDHIVALDAGRLVADGPLDELIGDGEGVTLELVEAVEPARRVEAVEPARRVEAVEPARRVDRVERTLRDAGIEVERSGTTLRLSGRGRDDLCDLARDAVAEAGARLRRLEARQRTLADLFDPDRFGTDAP